MGLHLFRWTGAFLFFISLAYFLFTYVTRFGVASTGSDAASATMWNAVLFSAFALHHSVFARERIRRAVAQTVPASLERSVYVWIASLLFILVCAWWRPVPGVAWQADGVALWLLRALQAVGVGVTLTSATVLDIRDLAGLRPQGPGHSSMPLGPEAQAPGPVFKTTGPYGWVRHPIYSGWFLIVLAVSPMTLTRLVFAVLSCAYLLIAIPLEERSMRASSHGVYDRYMAKVRWRLLPGVFGWWLVVGSW